MYSPQRGGRVKGCVRLCVWTRPGTLIFSARYVGLLLLAASLAGILKAQNPGGLDCTDPLLASTSACSGQSQSGSENPFQIGAPGSYNTPSVSSQGISNGIPNYNGNFPSTYSDIEQLTRQAAAQPTPLPPEPLTEFQKFVASTTGLVLPVYGANLFRRTPSTFAPVDMAPVPADYVIGPGDELRIRIWGQVSRQANIRVDRSGEIYLPDVGQVHVAGLAFSELDAHLRQAVGRVYHNFDLTVDVGQIRAIQIYVSGQARRPGVYTVSSLSTLADALFASGGPSVEGSMRSIELRRDGATVTRFDLYDLLIRGDKTKDVKLLAGDVIFIPPVGPEAAVFGSVKNPAIYELRPQESLEGVLADAGGVSAVAAQARVSIERVDEHRDRVAMEAAYDASGLATPLADGDVIRVYSIVPQYRKTVMLRGNIANPGRFAWHEGMRVSELIPDKDSLLTRNYWWRRAQLGLPAPEFEPIPGFANLRQPADNHPIQIPRSALGQGMNGANPAAADQGQGTGQFGAQSPYGSTPYSSGNTQDQSAYAQDQNAYSADQYASQGGYGQQQGQPGPGQSQNLGAQQRAGSSPLAAEETVGRSQSMAASQRTEVSLSAPEIDWDYAVVERVDPETLKTQLLPFDLGKLVLQHDAAQDLELKPDDVVSIFSEADIRVPVAEQTKLIRLEGEFVHAGVYSALPGETLRHLAERAGGLTPNAYLYASEFTRVSTRAVQQARIDEYVQSLSLSIQRGIVSLASSPAVAAQGVATGGIAQSSEQTLLASLRQIRATGRIVLSLHPASTGVNSLPDLPLEDGDRFVVPHVPATVNVVGAVYDQNSFLYAENSRAGTYLRLAGGLNKDADRKHEFVIRADGDVVSRDSSRGPWGNEFNNLRMYPGDTIVVPEKILKQSALYGIMNWSQMFSQFALGAAALDVIH
jgi:protein involved in polysaccharide export with SLBB domain